jgi:hypothetical protein
LAFFDFEISLGFKVLASELDGSAENDPIRARDRAYPVVLQAANSGNHGSVIETQRKFHLHRHTTADAANNSDYILVASTTIHAVDQYDRSFGNREFGLQN